MPTLTTTNPAGEKAFVHRHGGGNAQAETGPSVDFGPEPRPRARDRVGALPVGRLEVELAELTRQLHSGTYELLVLVGEFDARGAWALRGALSCAAWLAGFCDIEIATAHTQVRVARALRAYPLLDEAMAGGDVSYAKARVLVPHLTDENFEPLLEIAETTPAGRLGAAIAAWSTRNEEPEVIDQRQHDARSLSWRVEPDGMVTFTLKVPPLAAGQIQAHVEAEVMRADAPAGAVPTLAQQRADALLEVLERSGSVGSDGVPAAPAAEIVVHVRPDGNALADGTPLSDHAVASLLPEAFVSLLITDNQRNPIDASPQRRFPTRRQRRVVDERFAECAHPGCHARTFLQYDHIQPYREGGPTVIANLQRLCGPHNRAKESTRPGRVQPANQLVDPDQVKKSSSILTTR